MADVKLIVPASVTNLITNPSAELDLTGWATAGTNTIVRSADAQAFGVWSVKATYQNDATLAIWSLTLPTTSTRYVFSAWVYLPDDWDGGDVSVGDVSTFASATTVSSEVASTTGVWTRIWTVVDVSSDVTGDVTIEAAGTPTAGRFIYVDGLQAEEQSEVSTYCDGDQLGCDWAGSVHASTSSRPVTDRRGGFERSFTADLGATSVSTINGAGFPALQHLTQPLGSRDGADVQRIRAEPAILTMRLHVKEATRATYHATRRALVDAVKPDRTPGFQPLTLIYDGSGTELELPVHYLQGFDGLIQPGRYEPVDVQFVGYDPRWRARLDSGVSLTVSEALTDANRIVARIGGTWQALSTGAADGSVQAMAASSDGRLFVAGSFTAIGGVTAANIAVYDPASESFSALGSGLGTGGTHNVEAIAVDAEDNVYAVGDFTVSGATTVNRVAKWNGSSWVALIDSLGTGLSDTAFSVMVARDGRVYIGGKFATAGGRSAKGVTYWDGLRFHDLNGVTLNSSGGVVAMAETLNGDIYAGGNFFTPTFDFEDLARYTPSTNTWAQVEDAFDNAVVDLDLGVDGLVYVSGDFANPEAHIATWNGRQLAGLDGGANARVRKMVFDADGFLYAGGLFTSIGQIRGDRVARWDGGKWAPLPVALGPSSGVSGEGGVEDVYVAGTRLYVGGGFSGTALRAAVTTVSNDGSSEAYPVFRIAGPGLLRAIENLTSDDELLFDDFEILAGETITIDLQPDRKSITSDKRGNVIRFLLPGSDLATWRLLPGDNEVAVLIRSTPVIRRRGDWDADQSTADSTVNLSLDAAQDGDVLVATMVIEGDPPSNITITPPTGWTLIRRTDLSLAGTNDVTLASYWKHWQTGDPGSYAFTLDSGRDFAAAITAYDGVNTTTPIDVDGESTKTSATTTHELASVTTTGRQRHLIAVVAADQNSGLEDFNEPIGFDVEFQSTPNSPTPRLEVWSRHVEPAGATGNPEFTSDASHESVAHAIALKPASTTQPTCEMFFRPRYWGAE